MTNDNKPFWRYIKAKRKDTIGVAPLLDNGILHNDSQAKATILNKQFESVFTKGDSIEDIPALEGNPFPDITRLSVDVRGTHTLLTQLKVNKTSGYSENWHQFWRQYFNNLLIRTLCQMTGVMLMLHHSTKKEIAIRPLIIDQYL